MRRSQIRLASKSVIPTELSNWVQCGGNEFFFKNIDPAPAQELYLVNPVDLMLVRSYLFEASKPPPEGAAVAFVIQLPIDKWREIFTKPVSAPEGIPREWMARLALWVGRAVGERLAGASSREEILQAFLRLPKGSKNIILTALGGWMSTIPFLEDIPYAFQSVLIVHEDGPLRANLEAAERAAKVNQPSIVTTDKTLMEGLDEAFGKWIENGC